MKTAIFAALMMASVFASAKDNVTNVPSPVAQQYTYSTHLDIAKVISMSTAKVGNDESGLAEAHMVYVDHQGATHSVEYTVEAYTDKQS
jgi:hypothetical protein